MPLPAACGPRESEESPSSVRRSSSLRGSPRAWSQTLSPHFHHSSFGVRKFSRSFFAHVRFLPQTMTKPAPRPRPLSPGTRAFGPGPLPACPGSPGRLLFSNWSISSRGHLAISGDSFDRDDLRSGCAKPTTIGKDPSTRHRPTPNVTGVEVENSNLLA